MLGKSLINFSPLEEGILLKRYKRFLADVELTSGKVVTAHCANTGPMRSVLNLGGRVRLRYAPSPTRKLSWSWEQAEVQGVDDLPCWVGVNTSLPNTLIRLAIQAGFLKDQLGEIKEIRKEVTYGSNRRSRIDLLLSPHGGNSDARDIYLEVKNTTWREGCLGVFPDTVSERGQKHLIELVGVLPASRAVLVPCLSRSDLKRFAPGDSADPTYGKLFREALNAGVEVIPCCFGFHCDHITWEGTRPYQRHQMHSD